MKTELSMDQVFVKKLTDALEVNFANNQFGVKEFASELGVSRSKLHRKLYILHKKSPSRFIREFRLKKAMEMLQNNVATASEIAYQVGFGSPTYFNTCFHEYYGYPPGEVKFRSEVLNKEIGKARSFEKSISTHDLKNTDKTWKKQPNQRILLFSSIGILLLCSVLFAYYKDYTDNKLSEVKRSRNSS